MRYGFSKKPLILKTASGEDIVMYDPECEIAQRFPNLYYLFHEGIQAILEEYGERAEKTLDWFESELQKTIDHCGTDKTVYRWYYGKLDKDFFYNTKTGCFRNILFQKLNKRV